MVPAFGAGGVGVVVLLYLLFAASAPSSPSVIQPAASVVPTVVVQPMVPSVLGPANPAGSTVQEIAPPALPPNAHPDEGEPRPERPSDAERTTPRGKSVANSSTSSSRKRGENGTVVIGASGGWADVFLGTRRLGTTPVVAALPPGTHTLTVYPFGKGPAQRSRIEVKAGEQVKHKLDLAR
jgi:hypothetical protein